MKTSKDIIFGKKAQEKLLTGVHLLYETVCTTLSPKGNNVAIQRNWGTPIVVHDGVTVAKEVRSTDKFVQMGIDMVKEAAQKTNEEAGDGTTTSTLLAYEIVSRGMKLKENGVNPMVLRDEIYQALADTKDELTKISKPAKTVSELQQVATISSASKEIGDMVGKAVFEMGIEGLVTVEESGSYETYVDKTDGMSIARGFSSPYFITDPNRNEAVVNNPVIIITDRNITTQLEIVPIIEAIVTKGFKNIVIVGDVGGVALKILVANKMNGTINCLVVKPPGYGENKIGFLEDIAIVTGGRVVASDADMDVNDLSFLGKADKVVADMKVTMIVGGKGKSEDIKDQVKVVKGLLAKAPNVAIKEAYEERLAKMTTGVAVVRVGAKTETEAREKVERVKDAVGAAKSALEEGIVAGSGITFLRLAQAIKGDSDGARLMREVLEQPMRKVMLNCGESQKTIGEIMTSIKKNGKYKEGYEAMGGKVVDLMEAGIIDPTKVVRLCMENAVSVGTMILTISRLIPMQEMPPRE